MLDVRGFVVPEDNYAGLYKMGDTLQRNRYRKEAEAERKQGQQLADTKFIANYFDPKEFLTGSPLDPQSQSLLDKAYKQALDLNKQGANLAQVMGATAPLVNQLNEYMVKGKHFNEQKKIALQEAGKIKGIDANKLSAEMDKMAFPINPQTGQVDFANFDPNTNYADLALRNGEVYNNQGFDDFIKTAKLNTSVGQAKSINSKGGYVKHKAELSAPNFYTSETDADGNHIGFVPAYEVATDDNGEHLYEFTNEDGTKTKAPIRLLDKAVFNDLPPDAKGYVLQEARKYAKEHGVELNSVQAENLARAIAYDELNSKSKKYGTVKNIDETKAAPTRNITNVNVGGKGSYGTNINDLYQRIYDATQNPDINVKATGQKATRFNALDSDAQDLIIGYVNKGRETKVEPEDIFLTNEDGGVKVYKVNDRKEPIPELKNLLYTLPKLATNVKAAVDVKGKRAVLAEENKNNQAGKKIKISW